MMLITSLRHECVLGTSQRTEPGDLWYRIFWFYLSMDLLSPFQSGQATHTQPLAIKYVQRISPRGSSTTVLVSYPLP